jgi:hypothetical protein
MYSKLMEKGFLFDFDHMELHMKSQALDLTEAQAIHYPIISTHGTFGGTSIKQAQRVLKNGGFIYPSLNRSTSFINEMHETRDVYDAIKASLPADDQLFGFGFGTDTNGLSGQAGTEDIGVPGNASGYTYSLFGGGAFASLSEFAGIAPVSFGKPASHNLDGTVAHEWDIASDGSAHYGMLSDFVEAMNLHGSSQDMRDLFNSAERYLRTWERTLDAKAAIDANGSVVVPASVLIAAPTPGGAYPAGD